jgi:hypothetical protein
MISKRAFPASNGRVTLLHTVSSNDTEKEIVDTKKHISNPCATVELVSGREV